MLECIDISNRIYNVLNGQNVSFTRSTNVHFASLDLVQVQLRLIDATNLVSPSSSIFATFSFRGTELSKTDVVHPLTQVITGDVSYEGINYVAHCIPAIFVARQQLEVVSSLKRLILHHVVK